MVCNWNDVLWTIYLYAEIHLKYFCISKFHNRHTLPRTPDMIGAKIEPNRANMDATAIALFRITVGNNSAV